MSNEQRYAGRLSLWVVLPVMVVFVAALWRQTDADVHRYFAYSSAALGRPFNSFYVRSYETWQGDFIAGKLGRPGDFPTIVPGRPLIPYRDFLVEYPPGFFLAALPPAFLTADESVYKFLFEIWMAAFLCAALLSCVRIAPHLGAPLDASELIVWGTIAALALGRVTLQRCDPLVAFLICLMCWAALARRPIVLGLAAGAATAVKIVPLLVGVLCGMYLVRDRRTREAIQASAVAALTAAAICVPVVIVSGLHGLLQVLQYHRDRPLEFESTAAAMLGLWHAVDPRSAAVVFSYGSGNVVGRFAPVALTASIAALVAALALAYLGAWRALGPERVAPEPAARVLVVSTTTVLAVIIALGKVGSLQYLVWVLPLGVLAALAAGDRVGLALLLATLTAAQVVFPLSSAAAESMRSWPYAIVLARNVLLLVWAGRTFVRVVWSGEWMIRWRQRSFRAR
jgi:uncharacterized membrane protein